MDLIADTSYLVGLWRGQSWATTHAANNLTRSLALPWVVLAEFWHGSLLAEHDPAEVREFLALGVPIIEAGAMVSAYAKICAELSPRSAYKSIGQNDLWIAAVAVTLDKPLVTRNVRHFDQIPGLRLEVLEKP